MIWFDLKEMEHELSSNGISEKESVSYYLGGFLISSIYAIIVALVSKSTFDSSRAIVALHYLLDTIIIFVGLIYVYRLNSKIDNKDFFMRFFSLSFVILIRLIVFTISIGIVLMIFISLFIRFHSFNEILMSYIGHLWKILYYVLVVLSFRKINTLKKQNI